MDIKRIKLDALKNTRDLGGIKTAQGKYIKPFKLIRSCQLSGVSEKDINILTQKYKLSVVIDLRTDAEIRENPEKLPEGVRYVHLPLLDISFLGITRDEYSVNAWLNMFKDSDADAKKIFGDMYQHIVFGERSKTYIREFFDILLNNESGAVLWHCSAGKDRVGILTLLLLSALGVDRHSVIKDYLASARFTASDIIKARIYAPFILRKKRAREGFYVLMGVKKIYVERIFQKIDIEYGTVENFLFEQFGITGEEIEKLKCKYLG